MPGPLPSKNARRRNKPTIPTTELPASGRPGRAPAPPVELGVAASAWWAWAWATPQAAGWSDGDLYALARRALLEDDLCAVELVDELDLAELLHIDEEHDALKRLEEVIRKLKALAGGKMALLREARELDDRYGLTAKGLAALRWTIVAEKEPTPAPAPRAQRHLQAVDPSAVAGS